MKGKTRFSAPPTGVLLLALGLLLGGASDALTRVPGSEVYYSARKDPITDVNTGTVVLYEQYDQYGDTALVIRCANSGETELWSYLSSKNDLFTQTDARLGVMPDVIYRLGNQAPVTLNPASLSTTSNADDTTDLKAVGMSTTITRGLVNGLNSGLKLVLRVHRTGGGAPLTYTFQPKGFKTAWAAVKQCR